ncbi:hypothetical protein [Caballeronia sp. S22]|uniref:hypothetical protein n=1 Tax=Caballeronia sp. S22 TaxID=3137182 RepID=UPI003530CB1F
MIVRLAALDRLWLGEAEMHRLHFFREGISGRLPSMNRRSIRAAAEKAVSMEASMSTSVSITKAARHAVALLSVALIGR